jgi:hypothetical protein
MVKNRLYNFIRQSILWILLFFPFCLLLTSCIGIANLITAPNPASAANSADELLKALQQGDRKTVERLLANPRQTSELLQPNEPLDLLRIQDELRAPRRHHILLYHRRPHIIDAVA